MAAPRYPTHRGPVRFVLGDLVLTVATTRREGFWASSIIVGSRFVAEDLDAVRERLVASLA